MSVNVKIRTTKELKPMEILEPLGAVGEQILVTSDEFPTVKFGNMGKAIRGVEINKEDDGYNVRICVFASADDYRLFKLTIVVLMQLTGEKAYYEDDDDDPITCPMDRFDDKWIEEEQKSALNITRSLSAPPQCSKIEFFGIFITFCVGHKLLSGFDIPFKGRFKKSSMKKLYDYLCSVQWYFKDKADTSTRMVVRKEGKDPEDGLTISMIVKENGKIKDFDYISDASLFYLCDLDGHSESSPVVIPFERLEYILPKDIFRLIDDAQYERIGEFTVEDFYKMKEKAKLYTEDKYGEKHKAPGRGHDENQNTFILTWNTAVSNISLADHNYMLQNMLNSYFNWSVWDYEDVKPGDKFYMLRVGEGKTGIVMSGNFISRAYEANDWKGKGRKVYYADMEPNIILDPENAPMVGTEELSKAIPDFEWERGHSGRLLDQEAAKKLEKLWAAFIKKHCSSFDGVTMNGRNG